MELSFSFSFYLNSLLRGFLSNPSALTIGIYPRLLGFLLLGFSLSLGFSFYLLYLSLSYREFGFFYLCSYPVLLHWVKSSTTTGFVRLYLVDCTKKIPVLPYDILDEISHSNYCFLAFCFASPSFPVLWNFIAHFIFLTI